MSADAALKRVQDLMALATNPAASEAEARTAAFLAVRLIRQHRLLDEPRQPASAPPPEPKRSAPPPPPPPPPPARSARHGGGPGRFMFSRFQGQCKWCHQPYAAGDAIYWRGSGLGSDHKTCAMERADVEGD